MSPKYLLPISRALLGQAGHEFGQPDPISQSNGEPSSVPGRFNSRDGAWCSKPYWSDQKINVFNHLSALPNSKLLGARWGEASQLLQEVALPRKGFWGWFLREHSLLRRGIILPPSSLIHPSIHASAHPPIHPCICSSIHPCMHLSIPPCIHASIYLCIHPSIHPSMDVRGSPPQRRKSLQKGKSLALQRPQNLLLLTR